MTYKYDWVTIQCPYCFRKNRYTNITPKEANEMHKMHLLGCVLNPNNLKGNNNVIGTESNESV